MKRILRIGAAGVLILPLVGGVSERAHAVETSATDVIARFEGGEVRAGQFEAFLERKIGRLGGDPLSDAEKEQLLRAYLVLRDLAREGLADTGAWQKARQVLLRRALISEVRREPVDSGVALTDDDLRVYYHLHRDEFRVEEAYVFRHIFLNTAEVRMHAEDPTLPEADRLTAAEVQSRIAEKRQRADEAHTRLLNGEEFLEVAKQYSDSGGEGHPEERGIEMTAAVAEEGLYVRGRRIMPEMEAGIRSLEPGGFSAVFETKHGFEIVKVEEHIEAGVLPFEEVRERIARQLGREARRTRKAEIDAELLRGFRVEERFEVLDDPAAASDETVFRLSGSAGEKRFTVADYETFLSTLPQTLADRLRASPEERMGYLRDGLLLDEAALLYAQQKGLDRDEAVLRKLDADLLESMAFEEFSRRVQTTADRTPVEESELREFYAMPITQRLFSIGEQVRVEAFAVGTMATEEANPAALHFGKRYALRLAERIADEVRSGKPYDEVASRFTVSATEELSGAHQLALPGGPEALLLTGKPIGAHRVKALGDLGWVKQNDLLRMGVVSAEAAKAVVGLQPGGICDAPVEYRAAEDSELPGPEGYLAFRATERRDARVPPFDEVREDVERVFRSRRLRETRENVYTEMLASAAYTLERPAWEAMWRRWEER